MRRTRNAVGEKSPHRFKSCTLRIFNTETLSLASDGVSCESLNWHAGRLLNSEIGSHSAPAITGILAASAQIFSSTEEFIFYNALDRSLVGVFDKGDNAAYYRGCHARAAP